MKGDIIKNYKNVLQRKAQVEQIIKTIIPEQPLTIDQYYATNWSIPKWFLNLENRLRNINLDLEYQLIKNKESNLSSNMRRIVVYLKEK